MSDYTAADIEADKQAVLNACEAHDARYSEWAYAWGAAVRLFDRMDKLEASDRICRAMRTEAKTDGVAKGAQT